MVSMREVNRERVLELTHGYLFCLLKWLGNEKRKEISIRRAEVLRYLYEQLSKGGFSDEQIAVMLDEDISYIKSIKRGRRFSKGFLNALELFRNPIALLKKSDDYAYTYTISRNTVEIVIIQKLVSAGWTTRQIANATGYGVRRIQRIRKKLREEADEQQKR